jgi:two-component system sensor histidine kinase TctE
MLLIVSAASVFGFYVAQRQTAAVFDRWLLDAAVSLADQVHSDGTSIEVDLPAAAAAMLTYDEIDDVHFAVLQSGRRLVGQAGIPLQGDHASRYASGIAFDARYAGKEVRVALVQPRCPGCDSVSVLVSETVRKRERAQRSALWFLLPMGLLLAATAVTTFVAIRRTVRPLEALAAHWNRASHASLRAIPEGDLPLELAPFETALNDLLGRIRAMLARERQFAAVAAHQLRTPLAALRLGLDRARRASDLASARTIVAELDETTAHTARMVQQLLLLGRVDPEAGAGIDMVSVDLGRVVQEVCALMAEVALTKNVDLELRDSGAPVQVEGQAELLSECVANVLDNAIHAAGEDGHVLVTVTAEPAGFSVENSGPGLTTEDRARLFERFYRGPAARWQGSGLGLSIVRDIATLHGADVHVTDGALGGARFEVSFAAAPSGGGAYRRHD